MNYEIKVAYTSLDLEDRNAVNSELGLHILNCAVVKILIKKYYEQVGLFGELS